MTFDEILDKPYGYFDNHIDAFCLRDYFKVLLLTLWEEGEGFSGKRPFGNSGWEWDIYHCLISIGAVAGTVELDGDGFVSDSYGYDEDEMNGLVGELIHHIFKSKIDS